MKATIINGLTVVPYIYEDKIENSIEGEFDILQTKDGKYVLASDYRELRKAEYPPIEDYIDGIIKGDDIQIQEYIDKCLSIKAKYPKQKESK